MRTHFFSRLVLLLLAGFLVVASQVWTGGTLEWLFIAGGAVMILMALVDMGRDDRDQRALDVLVGLLGAWTIVQAVIFEGSDLKWWSFTSAVVLAGLATIGLMLHEARAERELGLTGRGDRGGRGPVPTA